VTKNMVVSQETTNARTEGEKKMLLVKRTLSLHIYTHTHTHTHTPRGSRASPCQAGAAAAAASIRPILREQSTRQTQLPSGEKKTITLNHTMNEQQISWFKASHTHAHTRTHTCIHARARAHKCKHTCTLTHASKTDESGAVAARKDLCSG
jgi:hypothetical protein